MSRFTQSMTTLVFRYIKLITIKFDAEGKFREIMIINAVAGDIQPFSLFMEMPEHFHEPVPEHDHFIFLHQKIFTKFTTLVINDKK